MTCPTKTEPVLMFDWKPLSTIQKSISEMVNVIWKRFDDVRENAKDLLRKLSDYKTDYGDLHDKIFKFEQHL